MLFFSQTLSFSRCTSERTIGKFCLLDWKLLTVCPTHSQFLHPKSETKICPNLILNNGTKFNTELSIGNGTMANNRATATEQRQMATATVHDKRNNLPHPLHDRVRTLHIYTYIFRYTLHTYQDSVHTVETQISRRTQGVRIILFSVPSTNNICKETRRNTFK